MKSNCTSPYKCSFCGDNCLRDKQVIFQLGSNDLLKREVPQYPYQRRKNTINVKWGKALNIMLQKMRFSAVYEVILMDIPEFPFLDITTGERYISIKSRLNQKFTDRAILVRSVDHIRLQGPNTDRYRSGDHWFKLVFALSEIRKKQRKSMRREMEKIAIRFSNKGENSLDCKMLFFHNEEFLRNNIHLTKRAQLERLADSRK